MPPNAETINLRHRGGVTGNEDDDADDDVASLIVSGSTTLTSTIHGVNVGRVDSIKNLKGHEVAIQGLIYDLSTFQHPGGNIVHIFGGNDVTVQYKMMHPHHTSRHLEKLKCVGRVTDWKSEYVFFTFFFKNLFVYVYIYLHSYFMSF